jgi:outer membrane receptor protein involved in Fe transport
VQLHDIGVYAENSTRFTPWLRTDIGFREEFYGGTDRSLIAGTVFSTAPFSQNVTLFQPKGSLALGPWSKTEIYLSAGRGYHSDDIRGVSGTVPLEGIPGTGAPSSLLVRADGEEVGLRSGLVPRTQIQVALFNIDLQSELVYDQDQGLDQPGPPSARSGVEVSAQYRPVRWLEVNTDLSFSHARFDLANRAALLANYGDAGTYIPNAPDFVGSFGVLVDNLGRWYGGLQVRVLGSYPLVSDNSQRDAGYTETNVNVGYKISPDLRAQIEVFNLFDVKANAGAYYYTTVISGDNGVPTADHQNHPLEPLSARVSVKAFF